MQDTDDRSSNPSPNPSLTQVIQRRFGRRNALTGSLAAAAAGFLGGGRSSPTPALARGRHRHKTLKFDEVPASTEDFVFVPDGYTWEVLVPWGTPLFRTSPAFAEDASNTAADQELQVGFNHDALHYAHGVTPWGTYLACEENWNGYFGTNDPSWTPTELEARYGVNATGFGYDWHVAEARFDLAMNRNEANHFGWCVEIDPFRPDSTPVKRTALGRMKHEGATITEVQGRIVAYTGDDQDGEYLYKFEGSKPWRSLRARGKSPLDHGTLYVAKFNDDGSGEWLALVHGEGPLTTADGWAYQADVLLRTRMAADAVGATRLHRPEWVTVDEKSGEVYVTLTNGSGNASAVNSNRDPNPYGHIVRFREHGHGGSPRTSFSWEIFVLAGDPAYDASVPVDQPVFGSPDGIWMDARGLVWIQTDISNSSQNLASRGYDNVGNNQMLVANPKTGELKRFLTGPRGCEITGVIMTPDERTMFVNVQHPGEWTSHWNSLYGTPSPANPTTVSTWPFGGRPRSATVVIRKLDGGKIGT